MYVWYNARKITLKMLALANIKDYLDVLNDLSNNSAIPKYATNLVYLTKAPSRRQIEKGSLILFLPTQQNGQIVTGSLILTGPMTHTRWNMMPRCY